MMTENIDALLREANIYKKILCLCCCLTSYHLRFFIFLFINLLKITKLLIPSLQVTEVLMQVMQSS